MIIHRYSVHLYTWLYILRTLKTLSPLIAKRLLGKWDIIEVLRPYCHSPWVHWIILKQCPHFPPPTQIQLEHEYPHNSILVMENFLHRYLQICCPTLIYQQSTLLCNTIPKQNHYYLMLVLYGWMKKIKSYILVIWVFPR